jgi:hypothetical protein
LEFQISNRFNFLNCQKALFCVSRVAVSVVDRKRKNEKMKIVRYFCTFLFSVPFLVLLLANILSYLSIDVEILWKNALFSFIGDEGTDSRSNQLILWSMNLPNQLRSIFEPEVCKTYLDTDKFQGVPVYLLFDEPYLDVQQEMYDIAKRSIHSFHDLLLFPPSFWKPNGKRSYKPDSRLIDYYQYSTNLSSSLEISVDQSNKSDDQENTEDTTHFQWNFIEFKNDSIIQVAQIYDRENIVNTTSRIIAEDKPVAADPMIADTDNNLDQLEDSSEFTDPKGTKTPPVPSEEHNTDKNNATIAGKDCSSVYRSAMVLESNLTLPVIFHLLSTWRGTDLFFMTKTWNVNTQYATIFCSFLIIFFLFVS